MGATWCPCRTKTFLANATGLKPQNRTAALRWITLPPLPYHEAFARRQLRCVDQTAMPD